MSTVWGRTLPAPDVPPEPPTPTSPRSALGQLGRKGLGWGGGRVQGPTAMLLVGLLRCIPRAGGRITIIVPIASQRGHPFPGLLEDLARHEEELLQVGVWLRGLCAHCEPPGPPSHPLSAPVEPGTHTRETPGLKR